MSVLLLTGLAIQVASPVPAPGPPAGGAPFGHPRPSRSVSLDERLAADHGVRLGDRVVVRAVPGGPGDTVVVTAFLKREADPSKVAKSEYEARLHLTQLQQLTGYGDRVDRFAVAAAPGRDREAVDRINAQAFGFRAHRSREVAVETSQTFAVVSRFHDAIGIITIAASAVFLLCIMLLKVEERRRDVAALRLMGISAASVVRSVVAEAALVALLGAGVGVGLGWGVSTVVNWYYQGLYRTPLRFAVVTPQVVLLAVALSVGLGVIAGLLAALRLVRTPPLTLLGR